MGLNETLRYLKLCQTTLQYPIFYFMNDSLTIILTIILYLYDRDGLLKVMLSLDELCNLQLHVPMFIFAVPKQ